MPRQPSIPTTLRSHASVVLTASAILLALAGCQTANNEASEFPRKPIKVIVPFAAGGGSDTFGRLIQSAIHDHELLPQKLVMINVPGAGGTIGSRRVKNAQPDGYTILLLHEGILTAKYSGQAGYGPEAFAAIAGTGSAPQVIAVADNSPFTDLSALIRAAAARPSEIVYAANIGAPSHFAGLMLEQQQPGALFRYAQMGGGAKRFEAVKGQHAAVSSFSIAEYASFRAAGLHAIAVLSPRRLADFPELPTAREQGFDVTSENMQYWWAPRGTPPQRLAIISDAIERAMKMPAVRQQLARMRIEPVILTDDALTRDIDRRSELIAAVSQRKIEGLPDFPLITLAITAGLGVIACRVRRREPQVPAEHEEARGPRRLVMSAMALTIAYVAGLQFAGISFVVATALYVLCFGVVVANALTAHRKMLLTRIAPLLAVVAVFLSLGIHFVFTRILVVDLP